MIRIFNKQHITVHTKRCCQCWSSQQRAQQDTVVCCNGRYIQHQAWGQKENNLPLNDAVSPSCLLCLKILKSLSTQQNKSLSVLHQIILASVRCITCLGVLWHVILFNIVVLLLSISCNRMYKLMRELKERYKVNRSNVI